MFDFGDIMIPFEWLHPADDGLRPARNPFHMEEIGLSREEITLFNKLCQVGRKQIRLFHGIFAKISFYLIAICGNENQMPCSSV